MAARSGKHTRNVCTTGEAAAHKALNSLFVSPERLKTKVSVLVKPQDSVRSLPRIPVVQRAVEGQVSPKK